MRLLKEVLCKPDKNMLAALLPYLLIELSLSPLFLFPLLSFLQFVEFSSSLCFFCPDFPLSPSLPLFYHSPAPPSIDTHPVSVTVDEWSQASMTCHINGSLPILVEWVREGGAGLPSTATPLQPITINNYMVRDGGFVHRGRQVFYICDSVQVRKLQCIRLHAVHLFSLISKVVWIGVLPLTIVSAFG